MGNGEGHRLHSPYMGRAGGQKKPSLGEGNTDADSQKWAKKHTQEPKQGLEESYEHKESLGTSVLIAALLTIAKR